jgi:hypothetical protein
LDKVKVLGAGRNWEWALKAVGCEMGKPKRFNGMDENEKWESRLESTAK